MIQLRGFCIWVLAVLCLISAQSASAELKGSYVEVASGAKIFTDFQPAERGRPTLVLLNGLTYGLEDWDDYVTALTKLDPGLGILRFDMIGMGNTLLKGKLPVDYWINHPDQVALTKELMDHFGIRKAYVAGLSYGGAIAIAFGSAHPEMVEQIILMAPFTEPLKKMDEFIRKQILMTRLTFPFNPASDDELYDFFLRNFIFTVYPSLERSVLANPYKLEAIFRMVAGIRKYDTLKDVEHLADNSTHLLVASKDQYIEKDVHDRFWKTVPSAARASRIDISGSEHKIPQAVPAYAAAWTLEIIKRNPYLSRGLDFQGNTKEFTAKAGNVVVSLKKSGR